MKETDIHKNLLDRDYLKVGTYTEILFSDNSKRFIELADKWTDTKNSNTRVTKKLYRKNLCVK